MSAMRKTAIERIADLFRLLESDFEGEVLGAVGAMKRLFQSEGLSFADIATVIANHQGEIEEKKYSDVDAEIIFKKGMEKGREEARRNNPSMLSGEFYDEFGEPKWNEIALWCAQHGAASERTAIHRRYVQPCAVACADGEASEVAAFDLL
jgi:hypothetical protein